MARYLDVEYDYVGYELGWKDMQRMLEDGEIDLLTSARKTPEREEIFDYSKPIGTNECMITVRSDNTNIIGQKYNTYDGSNFSIILSLFVVRIEEETRASSSPFGSLSSISLNPS